MPNVAAEARLTDLLARLARAEAVMARDHSRRIYDGTSDSYAYDFGALEQEVKGIALAVRRLAGVEAR